MNFFDLLLQFFQTHYHLAYGVLFAGSYFETLIGPGFFIHGEFFFLPGAILAGVGVLNIWLVAAFCMLGGILGDSSSFWIGEKYGKRVVARLFKKENKYLRPEIFEKAKTVFNDLGPKSVFFARFLGPISWITPFIAGTLDLKYRTFLKYNIPGVILGIGQFMAIGYFLGFSYQLFLGKIQALILAVITTVIIVLILIYKWKIPKNKPGSER